MTLSKKIFIASTAVFLTALLFWGVYFLIFKSESVLTSIPSQNTPDNSSSPTPSSVPKGKISPVSQDGVISPILKGDGVTIIYYSAQNGQVFQIDLEGNNRKIVADKTLLGLEKVLWSPDQTKALSRFQERKFSSYSYEEGRGGMLNPAIKSANFQNDQKIVYTFLDPTTGKASLNVADWDGKNWKKLADVDFYGQEIVPVPRSGLVSFWNSPGSSFETKFYTLPIIGGDKKLIFSGKFGGDFLWNHSGSRILVSASDERGGRKISLGVLDAQGQNYQDLGLPTFVSKCVWSKDEKTVYYALPGAMPKDAVLPDDYIQKKFKTTDTFWRMDLATGKKERVVELADIKDKIDAENLFFNSDESLLFFVNRYDGRIWRIQL